MSNLHKLKMVAVLFANLHIKKAIIQIWFQRTSQTLENYGTKWNTFCIKKQTIYFRIVHAILNLIALSMIFFISKIAKIRDTLLSAKPDANIHNEPTPPAAPNPLLTFSQISESNVSKLIRIHVQLKSSRTALIFWPGQSQWSKISHWQKFPDTFKIAHVTPLLKNFTRSKWIKQF